MFLLLLGATPELFAQGVIFALEKEIGELVYNAKPAVVTVLALKEGSSSAEGKGLFGLFGEREEAEKECKVGTGLIISSDGFVLTKESLLRNARFIDVALDNGTSHRAEWMECDSVRGVALIKISATGLSPAHFSVPDALHAGSWVTVIGNSMGVPHAVSVGVVSAIQPDGLVQISANVDPGSNGSPVFDVHAHAIGMVMGRVGLETSAPSSSEYFSNSALVHTFADMLPFVRAAMERYYAMHGWVGITVITDASEPSRPRILKLIENGPGHKSGLQVGDTITHFDGKEVDSPSTLGELVNQMRPGSVVPVKVNRMGQEITLEVRIAPRIRVALDELDVTTSVVPPPSESFPIKAVKRAEIRSESQLQMQRRIDALEREIREIKELQNSYKRN